MHTTAVLRLQTDAVAEEPTTAWTTRTWTVLEVLLDSAEGKTVEGQREREREREREGSGLLRLFQGEAEGILLSMLGILIQQTLQDQGLGCAHCGGEGSQGDSLSPSRLQASKQAREGGREGGRESVRVFVCGVDVGCGCGCQTCGIATTAHDI